MANIINLFAESGANMIGDDSTPTLQFENSSSGNALRTHVQASATGVGLRASSAASVIPAAQFDHTVLSSPTVATVTLTQSTASGAFFEFKGMLASIASAGSIVRGIRVKFGDEYGFLPVYASGTYI